MLDMNDLGFFVYMNEKENTLKNSSMKKISDLISEQVKPNSFSEENNNISWNTPPGEDED